MLILTDDDILKDIEGFQSRIRAAKDKLTKLPKGRLPYPEHKKREERRRILQDDLRHVENLILIAREALGDG